MKRALTGCSFISLLWLVCQLAELDSLVTVEMKSGHFCLGDEMSMAKPEILFAPEKSKLCEI